MKKRIIIIALMIMCLSISSFAATAEEQADIEPRWDGTFEFIFTPPQSGSLQRTFGFGYATSSAYVNLRQFLTSGGIGTTESRYCQDTSFVLIDYDAWENYGTTTAATRTINSGTSTGTQYFSYLSGYGPSYGTNVSLAAYPRSTSFSQSYGVNGYWYP